MVQIVIVVNWVCFASKISGRFRAAWNCGDRIFETLGIKIDIIITKSQKLSLNITFFNGTRKTHLNGLIIRDKKLMTFTAMTLIVITFVTLKTKSHIIIIGVKKFIFMWHCKNVISHDIKATIFIVTWNRAFPLTNIILKSNKNKKIVFADVALFNYDVYYYVLWWKLYVLFNHYWVYAYYL